MLRKTVHLLPSVALFPSCAFPMTDFGNIREQETFKNVSKFHLRFPTIKPLIVDNGVNQPEVPACATLIYCPELRTENASLGEARLLMRGLEEVPCGERCLKLHARCGVANIKNLEWQLRFAGDFLLLNRNVFAAKKIGINALPHIDTRVFCLERSLLQRLLGAVIENITKTGNLMEYAFLAAIYQNPDISAFVRSRGHFYPVMQGLSGHGRNYDGIYSRVRSVTKSSMFRFGL